jgi:2-(1,2-epoxy-1,2-dihydrophenyl)acetyl-CoA isomerase
MSSTENLLVSFDAGVLTLTINRPSAGNAVLPEMVPTIHAQFDRAARDPAVRALLIRSEGPNFSAGGDIRGFQRSIALPATERQSQFSLRLDLLSSLIEAYLSLPVPVVAACQGAIAGGGLMFALGADMVFADESTAFLFSHQRIGLPPDGGVSLLLPRAVGHRRASELILTAARVPAEEALRLGLVSRLVPADRLQADALEQARRFAKAPATAIALAKGLLSSAGTISPREQLQAERNAIVEAVSGPEFEEGVQAFLEKRSPRFS